MVYAGILVDPADLAANNWNVKSNLTLAMAEDYHKNKIGHVDGYDIDVTPAMSDIVSYRASLGHKTNHHILKANTQFYRFNSPRYIRAHHVAAYSPIHLSSVHCRFGSVRTVVTTRKIFRGEELFVDYSYDRDSFTPRWWQILDQPP